MKIKEFQEWAKQHLFINILIEPEYQETFHKDSPLGAVKTHHKIHTFISPTGMLLRIHINTHGTIIEAHGDSEIEIR